MSSDLDRQIEQLKRCEYIKEAEVKALCAKAREILVEESNVQRVDAPVTVSPWPWNSQRGRAGCCAPPGVPRVGLSRPVAVAAPRQAPRRSARWGLAHAAGLLGTG